MTEPISIEEDDQQVSEQCGAAATICKNRKEKRKLTKKEKRKQKRKELAEKARQEEEAKLNDPEELRRIQLEEEKEKERLERERREFEERERIFLEELARKKAQEEEEERRRAEDEEEKAKQSQLALENESDGDDEWEYVEDGPPEIIWQGNEITVKRNKVKVKKKDPNHVIVKEDPNRPTSNPLPPQSEGFADYKNASSLSAQQLLENVALQTPNFGTEQDKAHCPFHLKTGACRFGSRCSRVHFYPDKSCTLLMKNMYAGPGLAWEQDEGLENICPENSGGTCFLCGSAGDSYRTLYPVLQSDQRIMNCTDEEVERSYEEFYEDVHTEFLKFGEIINFKVCRNSSSHLRGNVYVQYKDIDSAVLAYRSINGRYFAGKQITCEFVSVTKWKVAICGEFMKAKLKSCSRGTTCNFIHCFRNPGGDYEWADLDKPPPRYWLKKMAALFGYTDESVYDRGLEQKTSEWMLNSYKIPAADSDRHRSIMSDSRERRSRPRENRSSRIHYEDYDVHKRAHEERDYCTDRKRRKILDKKRYVDETRQHEEETNQHGKNRYHSSDTDWDLSERERGRVSCTHSRRKRSRIHHNEKTGRQHCNGDSQKGVSHSDSDDDLLEKSRYRDAGSGNKERGSRHCKEDHSTDSSGEWFDEIGDRNLHHKKRRSRSRRHDSAPSSPDRRDKRRGSHDSNTTGDWTAAVTNKRKPSSNKSVDSDRDYQYHHNEDIEERGRWEPDEGATATLSKSSKGSEIDDSEDHNVESELNDDGDYSGSTTRGSSRSKKLKGSERNNKRQKEKDRSYDGHKQNKIDSLSSVRLVIPKDLLPSEVRENTLKKVSEVLNRFSREGMPLLHPEDDMKVQSGTYRKASSKIEALESLFEEHKIATSPLIKEKLKVLHKKKELTGKIRSMKRAMRTSKALAFKDELKARKRVLRRLGYITSEDVLESKGNVACLISSADELTLSELMLNGTFEKIKVEELVSLLSCFVWQEKLQDTQKPREELELLFAQLQDTARRVAKVQLESKVQIDVENFVSSFRPDIMEAVYAWAKGCKFYEIMEITQVFEGSLIRAIRRLEEVLQQLILAAKKVGDEEHEAKFKEAVAKIKRDIVFAASLYL